MCKKEVLFKDFDLFDVGKFNDMFIKVMVENFIFIECFIVVIGNRVVIGCLLEFVFDIF